MRYAEVQKVAGIVLVSAYTTDQVGGPVHSAVHPASLQLTWAMNQPLIGFVSAHLGHLALCCWI
jgi:hypothetical protein